MPDEILGLPGRIRAIGDVTRRQISSDTPNRGIGGPIGALTRNALGDNQTEEKILPWRIFQVSFDGLEPTLYLLARNIYALTMINDERLEFC